MVLCGGIVYIRICVWNVCVWIAGGREDRGPKSIYLYFYAVIARKGFLSKYVRTTPTISLISPVLMLYSTWLWSFNVSACKRLQKQEQGWWSNESREDG